MKHSWKGFFAGALAAALVLGLAVTGLAISGRMTIEVDPINIQVNGAVFQPKDVNGTDVPVFAYNGTTYAPLRALAEAYGLDVWYDAAKNIAAVGPAGSAPAQEPAPDPDADATWEEEGLGMGAGTPIFDLESAVGNYLYESDDSGTGGTRRCFVSLKPAEGGVYLDFDSSDHAGCKDLYVSSFATVGATIDGQGYFKVPFTAAGQAHYLMTSADWSPRRTFYLDGMMDKPLTWTEAAEW